MEWGLNSGIQSCKAGALTHTSSPFLLWFFEDGISQTIFLG
jgi:hypothetical protein